jgi:hypothetical protein
VVEQFVVRLRGPNRRRSSKWRDIVRRRRVVVLAAGVFLETAAVWIKSHRLGGNIVVRCRQGHLFTTIWIPAASVKSLRFGWWRVQYCPIGHHWTVVSPVKEAELSDEERRAAREHHDIRVP